MFDLSFGKLLLLFIVGLIVIGPAKLPVVIKKILTWVHALRRLSASVQMELNKELKIQEIQDALKKAEQVTTDQISPDLQHAIDELKKLTQDLKGDADNVSKQVNDSLEVIKKETEEVVDEMKSSAVIKSNPVESDKKDIKHE